MVGVYLSGTDDEKMMDEAPLVHGVLVFFGYLDLMMLSRKTS